MDVFTTFRTTPYLFQTLGQGGIYGNKVTQTYNAEGVFKLRRGITQGQDMQNVVSTATLHIKPSEPFVGLYLLEGNGIQHEGENYRIVGVTKGMNFDTNVLEHITLTLQVEATS